MTVDIHRYEWDNKPKASPCVSCQHWQGAKRCKAFGVKDIPIEIRSGQNDHTSAVSGDNGIQYMRKK